MATELPANARFRTAPAFGLLTNTAIFRSPLSKSVQTLELPGAQWTVTYELARMTVAVAGEWKAFLTNLMGAAGRFNAFDPSQLSPEGAYDSGSDTPLVNGASQTGKTLATKGWRNTGTDLLLPGDAFEITIDSKKRLYMVTANGSSDGGGLMTIAITPPLAGSPADSAALTLATPKVEMMLVDDGQALWSIPVNKLISGFSFSGIEVP